MKVLQVSKYMYPFIGGVEQVARDVAYALSLSGTEQKIICFNEDAKEGNYCCRRKETLHDRVDGIEVIRCGYIAKISSQSVSFTYPLELRKVMDSFQPDIVILHYPNPFVSQLLLQYKKRNFKLILYWHLDITKQKILGKLFHGQTMKLLRRADKIVATSPNYIKGSRYLQQFSEKCAVIPNCIRPERLAATQKVQENAQEIRKRYHGKIICLAVGRHVPYKGLIYLIQASRYLDRGFQILIGGNGPLTESLKEKAEKDAKIEFLGRINNEELASYYLACDIFAFPSVTKNEAFGIALAEGMFFGKPAVTFTIPGSGVNYVSLDRVTGIECPNGDSRVYAEAIKKLAEYPELREKYGKAAKQRVMENFTMEQFCRNIKQLLEEMDR